MARTTSEAVAAIVEVDVSISLTPFIEVANALVTECCADAYDATRLELIERWLAAHFYTVRDMREVSEGAGGVSASYQSAVALGFDSSHFGQMAIRIDTVGGLAALNERVKKGKRVGVVFQWLGTEKEELEEIE